MCYARYANNEGNARLQYATHACAMQGYGSVCKACMCNACMCNARHACDMSCVHSVSNGDGRFRSWLLAPSEATLKLLEPNRLRMRLRFSPIDLRAAAGSAIVFAFRSLTCWFRHRLCLSPIDPRAAAGSAFVFAVRPLTCAPRVGPPCVFAFVARR